MIKLLKYIKPYKKLVVLVFVFMILEVVMDLILPGLLAEIVDEGIKNNDMGIILNTGLRMIIVAITGFLGGAGCIVSSSYVGTDFGTNLRDDVFEKIQKFSFSNIDSFKTESLVTRLTNDVTQVQNSVLMALRMLLRAPLLFVGGIVMAMRINMEMVAILLVTIPVIGGFLFFILKKAFRMFRLLQKKLDRVNAITRENVSGVRLVKSFVREDLEKSRFNNANDELISITEKTWKMLMFAMPVMMLVINLSILAALWFGGVLWTEGRMDVGEIMAFINYMMLILASLIMATIVFMIASRAKASAERINEILDTGVGIKNPENPSSGKIVKGGVEFRDVTFVYDGGEPVLKDISFIINPGETVAILGATGSGKSSLVNLIPRLYDVKSGKVLVDGCDVRDYDLDILREGIGVVLQDAILFSGTIKDNIKWGKDDATDEEITKSARVAQAHDFVEGFEDEYDTIIGQRGVNVSGGQKQRLSIARAIVKKPPILIMDDSTSAVDMGTEYKIQKALKEELKETTVIVIAQRISSVIDADRIIVLEEGSIVGDGNHYELIKSNDAYRDIYISQLGEEALSNAQ